MECLKALRETPPDVLVLDTELKWGGADGVLAVMDEEDGLSKIPVVLLNDTEIRGPEASVRLRPSTIPVALLNDTDAKDADGSVLVAGPSTPIDDAMRLKWPDHNSIPSSGGGPIKLPLADQVVARLVKPFRSQSLPEFAGQHRYGDCAAAQPP